jgi:hypothetical protein
MKQTSFSLCLFMVIVLLSTVVFACKNPVSEPNPPVTETGGGEQTGNTGTVSSPSNGLEGTPTDDSGGGVSDDEQETDTPNEDPGPE